ncbi:PH domain-containing protein [Candidatus Daviesbacteria bacterium]|nr:PH domain-containing protein [Candidatus Daviesbacteria bacterium]
MAKLHYKESPTPAQKSSFAPYLAEDEELILVTGLSQAYIRSKFIIYLLMPGLILAVLGFGLGWFLHFTQTVSLILAFMLAILAATLKTFHLYHANRYLLTTRRVIIKKGLLAVKLTATLYDKITHLEVDQGIIDRLFLHHGTIIVNTAGLNKGEIVLQFVDYPMELKNLMERLINREREQFGLRGGSISAVEGEIIN